MILGTITLSAISMFLLMLMRWLASQRIWHEEDLLWKIWVSLNNHREIMIICLITLSLFVSAVWVLKTSFTYLETVLQASDEIYFGENEDVILPQELQTVEIKWKQVKRQMETNARAAKEAEQRKNDLIVYLAHDLKTPLTSVIGYLTLLRDEGEISKELRTKYLSISLDKAEHLEDLINEFFEITRFNLSTLTLEASRLNLTRMLEQLAYEFKPMLDEKNLVLILTAPKELNVIWDIGKMQRVFDNLLRNAVNYSFPNAEIQLLAEEDNDWIKITCSNQGNTIPKEKLNRIFEQFFRLDSSRSTKSGGAGVGLAIAKEIVELHGGTIHAESKNEEIKFVMRMPRIAK